MNKDIIKGFFDWDRRINRINAVVTPISTGFLLLLNYFKLIPQQISFINYILLFVYLGLYTSFFITVVLYQQKKQTEANLKRLQEDIEKLKSS
jgi:hypothetical protein